MKHILGVFLQNILTANTLVILSYMYDSGMLHHSTLHCSYKALYGRRIATYLSQIYNNCMVNTCTCTCTCISISQIYLWFRTDAERISF